MTEIPLEFNFDQMLAHVFPGFFAAITLFMLIDTFSGIQDLASKMITDSTAIIIFIVWLIIGGTILGILIDGIHHYLIEDILFGNHKEGFLKIMGKIFPTMEEEIVGFEDIKKRFCEDTHNCSKRKDCEFYNKSETYNPIKLYYLFNVKKNMDKFIFVLEYLTKSYYRYYEFFANMSLSLLPFSIISAYFLSNRIEVSPWFSFFWFLTSVILSIFCLNIAYIAYCRYTTALYFAVGRCDKS